jgi:hypothetical protein
MRPMASRMVWRRLVTALADKTPAFRPRTYEPTGSLLRRLLIALADASPAFSSLSAGDAPVASTSSSEPGYWRFRGLRKSRKEELHQRPARVRWQASESALMAARILDTRLVQAQDAAVTATLLQNVGPVLQALQPTKDAVIRAGALLIVKVDWVVTVHQLTPRQQLILDHSPNLQANPRQILEILAPGTPEIGPASPPEGSDTGSSSEDNDVGSSTT